jgi:uncharacterized protein with von Willebrand factor type A (vWA) domain
MHWESSKAHPDSNLLKHLLLFSHTLRINKVGVTTENLLDALRGISLIDLQSKTDFYHLLKSNFISSKEEGAVFDEIFDKFWSFENRHLPSITSTLEEETGGWAGEEAKTPSTLSMGKPLPPEGLEGKKEGDPSRTEVLRYSPEEVLSRKEFHDLDTEELEKVKEVVLSLTKRLALKLSRRWKKGKVDRIDFRRSVRQWIKYGGEMIELKRKKPKPKPLRMVLIGDVSGSMDVYIQFFLLFVYGLQRYYRQCETFVFSTRLSHITPLLKRKSFDEALNLLSDKVRDWSGGTNIGTSLNQFHMHHGTLLSPNRTVLIVFSDGWDRGDTSLLDSEIRYLKREVKKLIWLNPLAGSQGYEPLCKGMSVVLPFLDYFLPCHNLLSIKKLSHLIAQI